VSRRARKRSGLRLLAVAAGGLLVLGAAAAAFALQHAQIAPRQLGPYVERRTTGHNPLIERTGRWVGTTLVALDRGGDAMAAPQSALQLGAQARAAGVAEGVRQVPVADMAALRTALAGAQPGDVITLLPGSYRMGPVLVAGRAGNADAPIVVRAERPDSVVLEQDGSEGFRVTAPWWRFENLTVRGVCGDDSTCEHVFHVVGGAHHFAAVNNTLVDFNAHFKINGEGGAFPDHGLIASNTLTNTRARRTANPVVPIDLVAASDWVIRRNAISDFVKDGGDGVSYGAFAKGAGARNLFEQNLVVCEGRLRGMPGQRVGLSLGGGATGKPYCRDRACVVEQQQGTIRNNLIASCSDVGIYLNSAAQSTLLHNTLVDTVGIDVRYPGSSADVEGNLVDGMIRSRNDGVVRANDNLSAASLYAYLGYHSRRSLFADPAALDFAWRGDPPRRDGITHLPPDLCGQARGTHPAYGAFDSFAACLSNTSSTTSSSSSAN
jgi:parallel beta-helix repeat protein